MNYVATNLRAIAHVWVWSKRGLPRHITPPNNAQQWERMFAKHNKILIWTFVPRNDPLNTEAILQYYIKVCHRCVFYFSAHTVGTRNLAKQMVQMRRGSKLTINQCQVNPLTACRFLIFPARFHCACGYIV